MFVGPAGQTISSDTMTFSQAKSWLIKTMKTAGHGRYNLFIIEVAP